MTLIKLIDEDWIDDKIRILNQIIDNNTYGQAAKTSAHHKVRILEQVKEQLQSSVEAVSRAFEAGEADIISLKDYLKQNNYE